MKLSKKVLQTIALGIAIGTTSVACDLVESIEDIEIKKKEVADEPSPKELPVCGFVEEACLGCGRG